MGVEIEAQIANSVETIAKEIILGVPAPTNQQRTPLRKKLEDFNLTAALKLNLPLVLNQILALSKSINK